VQASAHGTPVAAVVTAGEADEVVVRWDAPVRRIAPGQSVVFYESGPCGELVVGGGIAV
jgi:tRNA-specific 2-thiouridylase